MTSELVKAMIVYAFQYQYSHLTARPNAVIVSMRQLIVGNGTLGVLTLRSLSRNFNLLTLLKSHCLHP